jgi:hypothetical protein
MKKCLAAILIFFLASFCFAWEQRNSFEIGLGYQRKAENYFGWATIEHSLAINFAGIMLFEDILGNMHGIGVYGNLIFPQETRVSGGGRSFTIDRSAFRDSFGIDLLAGPVFTLFNSGRFSLPVSMGVYLSYYHPIRTDLISYGSIGLGANLTGEYHINQNIYLFGRLQFTYDFYGQYFLFDPTSEWTRWGIGPSIGIAFKW